MRRAHILAVPCFVVAAAFVSCGDSHRPSPVDGTGEPPVLDRENPSVAVSKWQSPCVPWADCYGFVQLMLDRTLRVDRVGEYPPRLYEAVVSQHQLEAVLALATEPSLVDYLESGVECQVVPTDARIDVYVKIELASHEGSIFCNEAAAALANALWDLSKQYFGPPFAEDLPDS